MKARTVPQGNEKPDRLDGSFRLAIGLYIAMLVSPAVVFAGAPWLSASSAILSFGLLGTIITLIIASKVKCRGEFVPWLSSSRAAVFLSAFPGVFIFAYLGRVIEFVAVSVTSVDTQSVTSLAGTVGFLLAMTASCLGVALVYIARAQLADATLDGRAIDAEWTAGWPRQRLLKFRVGLVLLIVTVVGVGWWWRASPPLALLYLSALSLVVLAYLEREETYRASSIGLEQSQSQWVYETSEVIPWNEFTGFTVTDTAIVLHRRFPAMDVHLSRRQLIEDEAEILETLEAYLDRSD